MALPVRVQLLGTGSLPFGGTERAIDYPDRLKDERRRGESGTTRGRLLWMYAKSGPLDAEEVEKVVIFQK